MTPPARPEPDKLERKRRKSWLCSLGFHGYPRSQGEVGYCPRGCGDLKRTRNAGAYWTRYVEPPPPDSRPPVGMPPRGTIPTPYIRFSVARRDAFHTLRLLGETRARRINVRIEPERAYFDASQVLDSLYALLDSAGIEYSISGENHPTPVGR